MTGAFTGGVDAIVTLLTTVSDAAVVEKCRDPSIVVVTGVAFGGGLHVVCRKTLRNSAIVTTGAIA